MRVSVPRERTIMEGRVALAPQACRHLISAGAQVTVEARAGEASGYADDDYRAAGARIATDADALWRDADIVVKVKEPLSEEVERLRRGQTLFCYLHLAARPALARGLCASGATAIGFETVIDAAGTLPLLAPMSVIAGRLAAQIGSNPLHGYAGGRGILLGGVAGVERGRVVVLGAGQAGAAAARAAAALGAEVQVFDLDHARLAALAATANITALYAYPDAMEAAAREADLLIGAILVPGRRAPVVISEPTVRAMRAGAVICDIAVDQGGCVATTRPTNYQEPTYLRHGVVHFAVANMPGAVPRTASAALSARLVPYLLRMQKPDWEQDPALAGGINVRAGKLVHAGVAEALAADASNE
jgi:alanine dehydrogenase